MILREAEWGICIQEKVRSQVEESMRVRENAELKANNLKVMPNTSKVVIIGLHQSRFKRSMSDLIYIELLLNDWPGDEGAFTRIGWNHMILTQAASSLIQIQTPIQPPSQLSTSNWHFKCFKNIGCTAFCLNTPQEEIEQINTPTKLDILQWIMLMGNWMALRHSIDLILNIECAMTAKKSIPSKNGRILWHQRF